MFEFSTNYAILFAALFLLISIFISYIFYRKTTVFPWKKYLLISVKTLAFFFLLMLFIQPVLLSLLGKSKPALNIVLMDNSRSTKITGKSLTGEFISSIKKGVENSALFAFSNNISRLENTDSLLHDGPYTDLARAIEQIKTLQQDNLVNSVTVISDGNFNTGGNPLYNSKALNCPFITVPSGDSVQQKDILVYNAAYNKTAYINTKTSIIAYIKIYRADVGSLKLVIEKDGDALSERQVNVTPGVNSYTADFDITESSPGKYKYRIKAENIPGEVTNINNYYDFYIDFLDNKTKLLYISGGPSYDNAVISGIVKRINNFEITIRNLKNPSEFYEGKIDPLVYSNLSAVMLIDFPSSKYSGKDLDEISLNAKKFGIPVIFYAGKNADYKKLEIVSDLTPFTITQTSSSESNVKLQPVSVAGNVPQNVTFEGANLPELNRNFKGVVPKAGALTLIVDKFSGEPVLITRNNGSFSTTAFLAYGFWQWNLKGGHEKGIEEIIEKSIKLSLNKNKNKKFILTPLNEFFDYSENVIIKGEVFDEKNNPAVNAVVRGSIKDKNNVKVKDIEFRFNKGEYYSDCGKIPIGDYIVEGEAELSGSIYAKDNNRFSVDTLNTEYLQTVNDYQSLRELSNNTGGTFANPENLLETISNTHNQYVTGKSGISSRINLRENAHYLALIILLFSIEWVVRKRNNIP